jgi:beta-galactosidase
VAQGGLEAAQAAKDLVPLDLPEKPERAAVALLFSYEADWLFQTQPQGQDFRYIELVFEMYSALRQLGLNVDIVSHRAPLDGYQMIVAPSLPILSAELVARLEALQVPIIFGPRSGSKTGDFKIPTELPPGLLQAVLPVKVSRVESLRPSLTADRNGEQVTRWSEEIISAIPSGNDGDIVHRQNDFQYISAWPSNDLLKSLFSEMAEEAGLSVFALPSDLRVRTTGSYVFAFNYGPDKLSLSELDFWSRGWEFVSGTVELEPAGIVIWKKPD